VQRFHSRGISVFTRPRSAAGTLVERTTRLVILARMGGTDATSARQGFTKTLRHIPAPLRKTLTYDQGKEMAEHEQLAQRLAIQIFFAEPYSPPGNVAPTKTPMACCASTPAQRDELVRLYPA
jgi:IS30 family transposase